MRFGSKQQSEDNIRPNTVIGVGSSVRGTLMIGGTLRIDGEFEGDVLSCERLEIGEHGVLRSDVEVREAMIRGRVIGSVRALGVIELKTGARMDGDISAFSVVMEPGGHFTGRCTMLEAGSEGIELSS